MGSVITERRKTPLQTGIRQRSLRKHCRLGRATELVFVLVTGAMLTIGGQAQSQVWNGSTSTDYNTGANWNSGTVPGSGGFAIFSTPGPLTFGTVDLGGSTVELESIVVSSSDAVTSIGNGTFRFGGGTSNRINYASLISNVFANDLTFDLNGQGLGFEGVRSFAMPGSITNSVATAATLDIGGSDSRTVTISGVISGGANMAVQLSGGNANLTGVNTYSGGTIVGSGRTMTAGNAAALGTGDVTLNGGMLNLGVSGMSLGNNLTFGAAGGTLRTNGALTVTLAGNITQTGAAAYGNGTAASTFTITSGTVTGTGAATIANNATVVLNSAAAGNILANGAVVNGTLDLNNNDTTAADLTGSGKVTHAGGGSITLTVGGAGNSTFAGVIEDGAGAVGLTVEKTNATDVFKLTGTNTYTSLTEVKKGILALGAGNILSDRTVILLNPEGSLDITDGDQAVRAVTSNSATTGVNLGTRRLSIINDGLSEFGGAIIGTGGLTLGANGTSTGRLTLDGANTYTGATIVDSGTLVLSGGQAMADTGAVQLNNGAASQLTVSTGEVIGSLSGVAATKLQLDADLTISGATNTTFAGGITGASGLRNTGTGTLVVSANNAAYTGAVTASGGGGFSGGVTSFGSGTITLSHGSKLNLTTGGTLANALSFGTSGGTLSTDNGLAVRLDGNLTQGFPVQYGNGTTVSQFTIGGTAVAMFPGTIAEKTTVILDSATAANLFASNGVVNGILDLNGRTLATSALSGTGTILSNNPADTAVTVTGPGTFAAAFADTNDGSTGVLALNVAVGAGNTVTLTGDSTHTGNTNLNNGALVVNGSLTSTVTANAGRLSGAGQIGGLTAKTGATIAPGNSIGTLNVAGDVQFEAGSEFEVEVDPTDTTSDLIATTGAATLTGGKVSHIGNNGTYQPFASYTILTAAGGVTGEFAEVGSTYTFLDPKLTYSANSVALTLERNDLAFSAVAQTDNQRAAASGVDSLQRTDPVVTALFPLDAAQARAAFDSLSGEVHGAAGAGQVSMGVKLGEALGSRARAQTPTAGNATRTRLSFGVTASSKGGPGGAVQQAPRSWATALGTSSIGGATLNTAESQTSTNGFLLGFDAYRDQTFTAGIYGAQTGGFTKISARASTARLSGPYVGAYAFGALGNLRFSTSLSYGWNTTESTRNIAVGAVTNKLTARYASRSVVASGELGHGFTAGIAEYEPFVNVTQIHTATDGFTEAGGIGALTRGAQTSDTTLATVGLNANTQIEVGGLQTLLSGSLGVRHALGDALGASSHSLVGGNAFTVQSGAMDRTAGILDAGIDIEIAPNANLSLSYQGVLGNTNRSHNVGAGLNVSF